MQESVLYGYWQSLARSGQALHVQGNRLQVLEAGRLNRARGPDFRQARFKLNGTVYQGDVELHCVTADWYRHQHHLDGAYANVLLHVVAPGCKETPAVRHNMSVLPIPTLALPQSGQQLPQACRIGPANYPYLKFLGGQQLALRIAMFGRALQRHSYPQLLYEYMFRALGYSANSEPFQQLAARLPWSFVLKAARQPQGKQVLYSLYLFMAGFECCEELPAGLPSPDHQPLSQSAWQLAGVRPCNHPRLRLAGWVSLLCAHGLEIPQAVDHILVRRQPFPALYKSLRAFFRIPFREPAFAPVATPAPHNTPARYSFGFQRIDEILVNTLLPLSIARARVSGSSGYADYLDAFYHWLPGRVPYRSLQRAFSFEQKKLERLAYEQGLLYLNRYYCQAGHCLECPIGQSVHGPLSNQFSG